MRRRFCRPFAENLSIFLFHRFSYRCFFLRTRLSSCVSCCLLIFFTAISLGLPIPKASVRTNRFDVNESGEIERFPCENSPCGCRSARRCWDKCCCKSDAQKIAWAKANNVEPPAFLRARVLNASFSKDIVSSDGKRSCCRESPTAPASTRICCQQAAKSRLAQDDISRVVPRSACEKPTLQITKQAGCRFVLLDAYQRCNGIEAFWKLIQISVVEPFPVPVQRDLAPCLGDVISIAAFYASYQEAPDGPVPRASTFAI